MGKRYNKSIVYAIICLVILALIYYSGILSSTKEQIQEPEHEEPEREYVEHEEIHDELELL